MEIEVQVAQLNVRLYRNPHGLGLSSMEGHEFELHHFGIGHEAVSASQEAEGGKRGGLKFQWLRSWLKL